MPVPSVGMSPLEKNQLIKWLHNNNPLVARIGTPTASLSLLTTLTSTKTINIPLDNNHHHCLLNRYCRICSIGCRSIGTFQLILSSTIARRATSTITTTTTTLIIIPPDVRRRSISLETTSFHVDATATITNNKNNNNNIPPSSSSRMNKNNNKPF
jgi:hypothetical protein